MLRRRMGLPTLIAVSVWSVATVWVFSAPDVSIPELVTIAVGWYALGGFWLARLIGGLVAGGWQVVRSSWKWWASPALLVIVTSAAVVTHAPLMLRFNLSRDAMDAFAVQVMEGDDPDPSRVGWFPVKRVETFPGGMRFITGDCMVDKCGFAYSPQGRPPRITEDSYFRLDGPWYLWDESW